MNFVTIRLCALVLVVVTAGAIVSLSSASPPRYVPPDFAFVSMEGHGTVTSSPRGVACPRHCRALFVEGTHVVLRATPAAGWKLALFKSRWCTVRRSTCGFDLVSPHDCVGACPVGAFGVRVVFVRR